MRFQEFPEGNGRGLTYARKVTGRNVLTKDFSAVTVTGKNYHVTSRYCARNSDAYVTYHVTAYL